MTPSRIRLLHAIAFVTALPLTARGAARRRPAKRARLEREPAPIRWRGGETRSVALAADAAAVALGRLAARPAARHAVLQFADAVTPEERAQLAARGVELLSYLGEHAYFATVRATPANPNAVGVALQPIAVHEIRPAWRLHPALASGLAAPAHAIVDAADVDDPMVAAYIVFQADVDLANEALPLLQSYNVTVRDSVEVVNAFVIELPRSVIDALAQEDAVQWIEPPLPRLGGVWNDFNRFLTGAESAHAVPYDLDGSGISVLVYDGGTARASHVDFGGRLHVRDLSGEGFHATHVAGTVGGNGAASNGNYAGMAPEVTIEAYGFEYDGTGIFLYTNPGDLQADFSQAINVYGADVSNASLGTNVETNFLDCELQGDYGVTDQLIDSIVRGSLGAPFRAVWAAGNERQGTRCDDDLFSFYYSIAPPAGAKNHLCVGAVHSDTDDMTWFSSWGPTDDGRMKPDFCAPGCEFFGDEGVTSTTSDSDTSYGVSCGTSMAAPTMTGLAALFLQDFRAQFPTLSDPRNSTLKAIFAHTAVDRGNAGPDYQFGYGSVRILPALEQLRSGRWAEASVAHAGTVSYTVNVPPGASALKVTIAWDDYPGTPNVIPSLINDLDLRVFAPGGAQAFIWNLVPGDPSFPALVGGRNAVDNIEQVSAPNPAAGTWTVQVFGFNVPQGPQVFSIASTHALSTGSCSTPSDPTNVSATDAVACDYIDVNWNAVLGATGYEIWRSDSPSIGSAVQIGADDASPFRDSSAPLGGTPYFYWVRATNACGLSGYGGGDAGSKTGNTLTAPAGVAASQGTSCSATTITWNAVSGAVTYELWRNTSNNVGTATFVGADSASPFDDTSGAPGAVYHYWVRAFGNCGAGPFSAPATGFRATGGAPTAPSGVNASDNTSCLHVAVSWNAVSGATGYQIWRNTTNNSASATQIATDNASPYNDTTAVAGTTFFYWVKAVNACGASGFSASNSGSRSTSGGPGTPTKVAATDGTLCTGVTVTWKKPSGAINHEIWRGPNNSPASATLIGTNSGTSFTDTTAVPGLTYFYFVRATNACGPGAFSSSNTGWRKVCP